MLLDYSEVAVFFKTHLEMVVNHSFSMHTYKNMFLHLWNEHIQSCKWSFLTLKATLTSLTVEAMGKSLVFFCFCFWLLLKFSHCLWNCWWDSKHALVYWDECQFILQSGYEKPQSRSRNILVWNKRLDHHHHHPSSVEPSHQHCFFLKSPKGRLSSPQCSPHWLQTWETKEA